MPRWTESLSIVLLGHRLSYKEDLAGTSAEILYDTTQCLPAEFLQPSNPTELSLTDPPTFLQQLCDIKRQITPIPMSAHKNIADFVQPSLETCTHVLVCNDTVKATLTQPYNGSFHCTHKWQGICDCH